MKKLPKRLRARANALIEYVSPMSVLLIAVGVLTTIFGVNEIIGEYFMAASGHTSSDLQGGTFKTEPMASTAFGALSNGAGGFGGAAKMASMANGLGANLAAGYLPPGGVITGQEYAETIGPYSGSLLRGGGRINVGSATAGERLYVFDDERGGSLRPAPLPLEQVSTTIIP